MKDIEEYIKESKNLHALFGANKKPLEVNFPYGEKIDDINNIIDNSYLYTNFEGEKYMNIQIICKYNRIGKTKYCKGIYYDYGIIIHDKNEPIIRENAYFDLINTIKDNLRYATESEVKQLEHIMKKSKYTIN